MFTLQPVTNSTDSNTYVSSNTSPPITESTLLGSAEIIGIVSGALLTVGSIIFLFYYYHSKRHKKNTSSSRKTVFIKSINNIGKTGKIKAKYEYGRKCSFEDFPVYPEICTVSIGPYSPNSNKSDSISSCQTLLQVDPALTKSSWNSKKAQKKNLGNMDTLRSPPDPEYAKMLQSASSGF